MGFLQSFLSLASAGVLLISGTLQTAAPHQDPYGNLFLVNRAARISANWVPAVEDAGVPGQVRNMRADAAAALEDVLGIRIGDKKRAEIEVYTIVELVGSTCYSVILHSEPTDLESYLPYLHDSIRALLRSFQAEKGE